MTFDVGFWRIKARPIIIEVIERVGIDDIKLLRDQLRKQYPFGPKRYHPYKMWLKEIKAQIAARKRPPPDDQGDLFEDGFLDN